jgi:hypothetical protein
VVDLADLTAGLTGAGGRPVGRPPGPGRLRSVARWGLRCALVSADLGRPYDVATEHGPGYVRQPGPAGEAASTRGRAPVCQWHGCGKNPVYIFSRAMRSASCNRAWRARRSRPRLRRALEETKGPPTCWAMAITAGRGPFLLLEEVIKAVAEPPPDDPDQEPERLQTDPDLPVQLCVGPAHDALAHCGKPHPSRRPTLGPAGLLAGEIRPGRGSAEQAGAEETSTDTSARARDSPRRNA